MKPHDQLTIIRNRHRAGELRLFRDLVERYFAQSDCDENGAPLDWEGALSARSRINQMLPRMVQVIRAAGLTGSTGTSGATDPGVPLGRVEVLQQIFSARYTDGLDQEILDVIDMAIGVYEGDRYMALIRTFNPLHYAATALGFVARLPRRMLAGLGLWRSPRSTRLSAGDLARLESAAARVMKAEDLIDSRLGALQDRQGMLQGEQARQLAELAERLDFAERMLVQQGTVKRIAPPERGLKTPV
ncbi:MAG: hypothetical protein ACYC2K_13310 [Gemmatimonadales bacterium]